MTLRIPALLLVLFVGTAFAAPVPVEKPKEVDPLLGKWKVLDIKVGGVGTGKLTDDSAAFIKEDKIVFTGIPKEPDDTFGYKLDPKNKGHIDVNHQRKPGEVLDFKGVYDLTGDLLIIAFSLDPKADRPKVPNAGATVAYMKLERIKVKEEKK